MASQSSCAGVGPGEAGRTGKTQGVGAGGGLEGCAGSDRSTSAAARGRGSKGMGRGVSKGPSGMEEEGEHTIRDTREIVTPGMSEAVLGADFLEYLEEMGAGLLETCL